MFDRNGKAKGSVESILFTKQQASISRYGRENNDILTLNPFQPKHVAKVTPNNFSNSPEKTAKAAASRFGAIRRDSGIADQKRRK
jgi:hypothetical protein